MTAPQSLSIQQNLTIRLLRVLRYNKARIERAITLMPKAHQPLFNVLPFLLHVNHPDLPGYVDGDAIPMGINNYTFREDIASALITCFPEQRHLFTNIKEIWPRQRSIEALILMGSIGTIAQTEHSDFDYWVCVNGQDFSEAQLEKLQQKLTLIEQWAEHEYKVEVHFFLSQIDHVRQNNFGIADGESAGSAQALFLKAEFYNTNIVVAGKAPFWWLTPEKATHKQYQGLYSTLEKGGSPDINWFMDLGHIDRLDASELFGATIWQLSKAMDSPFKSLLKIAKLEVYLANIELGQPLCNVLKKHVHRGAEAPGSVAIIDPYGLMFDQLISHYKSQGQKEDVLLLQQCFYLKCGAKLSEPLPQGQKPNFKRKIITAYAKAWGWTRSDLHYLDNQHSWSFHQKLQFSRQIHRFLLKCYRRISAQLTPEQQVMDVKDMTVLGRRLSTFYSKKANKIDFLRRAFDAESYCDRVTVSLKQRKNGEQIWRVYAGDQLSKSGIVDEDQKISQADNAISLIAWCVSSRIIDSRTQVLLDYNSGEISELDLNDLLKHLCKHFPPVKVSALTRNQLLAPERIISCMVIVNFPTLRQKANVEDISMIYSTSWGETFVCHGEENLDALWLDMQDINNPAACFVYIPRGNQHSRIHGEFIENHAMSFTLLQ